MLYIHVSITLYFFFRSRSIKKKYKTQDDGLLYKNTSLSSAYSADTVQFIKSSENEVTASHKTDQYGTEAESVIYDNLIGRICILENRGICGINVLYTLCISSRYC